MGQRVKNLKKEIKKLWVIAQKSEIEYDFQQEPIYKSFKAKYSGGEDGISVLFYNLHEIHFYNESIYWCHKYLENRVCNILGKSNL